MESTEARHLSTGVLGAACVHRTMRNMGDLAAHGVTTEHAREERGVVRTRSRRGP